MREERKREREGRGGARTTERIEERGGKKGREKEPGVRVAADSGLDGARVKVYAPGRYLCIRRGVTTSH